MKTITLEESRERKVCRLCGEPEGGPYMLNYGREDACANCHDAWRADILQEIREMVGPRLDTWCALVLRMKWSGSSVTADKGDRLLMTELFGAELLEKFLAASPHLLGKDLLFGD